MLTEPCVMFFSPCGAVLSAILRDEYLTSAVRTKEGHSLSFFSSKAGGVRHEIRPIRMRHL